VSAPVAEPRPNSAQPPEDFTAFVTRYADRVRTACALLTGNDRLAESLRQDLFASVALRWWWLRRRPPKPLARADGAVAHLQRQLRREAANWPANGGRADLPRLRTDQVEAPVVPRVDLTDLAGQSWARAHRIRARRRRVGAVVAVAVVCAAFALPHNTPTRQPDEVVGTPLPTAIPAGVQVMRALDRITDLPTRKTPLPASFDMDAGRALPIVQAPITHALAVAQIESGPLIILADDGTTRRVDDEALGDARVITTSLAPDGGRVAMITGSGLLIVDLATGRLRQLVAATTGLAATRTLVWRTANSVLVPSGSGAQVIDVDTGQTTNLTGLSGVNVLTMQGPDVPTTPVELVPSSQGGTQPARIRVWRQEPSGAPGGLATPGASAAPSASVGATPTAIPSSGASPGDSVVEDRPIFAPTWVGRWGGSGWGNSGLLARPCDPGTLLLPRNVGVAHDAIAAVDIHGLYVRTLAAVEEGSTMDPLGFVDSQTALIRVSEGSRSWVVAWDVPNGSLEKVTSVNANVQMSLPDLLRS
jgi:hypothetical protein